MSGKTVLKYRPCQRCGLDRPYREGRPQPICMDCRAADPTWVRAVRAGQPLIPRRDVA